MITKDLPSYHMIQPVPRSIESTTSVGLALERVFTLALQLVPTALACGVIAGDWRWAKPKELHQSPSPMLLTRLHLFCKDFVLHKSLTTTSDTHVISLSLLQVGIRAYVCIPIMADGEVVGVCCLIDYRSRSWNSKQLRLLSDLAAIAATELMLEHERQRRQSLESYVPHIHDLEQLRALAGGVVHDIANLLGAVQGNAQLALLHIPPDSPARASLRNIGGAACSAAALARQVLRAVTGDTDEGEWAAVDLSILAEDLVTAFLPAIPHHINVHLELEPKTPALIGAPAQFSQLILNLLVNAVEAIGNQPGIITLYIYSLDDDHVALKITDTGCGIDVAFQDTLFTGGYTTKIHGHGLGLAVVYSIIERYNGTIEVNSILGEGTTVTALFPCSLPFQENTNEEVDNQVLYARAYGDSNQR